RPRFRDLFLAPGETADLAPRLVYTDDTQQPLKDGVRFASDTPAVAAVDRTGLVKGIAPGVATVSLTAHGREATARVIVDKADGFPHFARDGHVLTRYDAARSLWVRSLFGLGPDEVEHMPRLAAAARAAAINTLTAGFYLNPADGGQPADFAAWRKSWEPR